MAYLYIIGYSTLITFYFVGVVKACKLTKIYVEMWKEIEAEPEFKDIKILKRGKWFYFLPCVFSWLAVQSLSKMTGGRLEKK